ncbi:MAG TPA: glycosyltransferase [Candidatus Kapabacteria bacterium]|nr:glycosyltransferase [Candidatus Kapabacteria bacterium]HPU23803.1 glycosyltransferase [Candidatus Kapabacteria bacterium]
MKLLYLMYRFPYPLDKGDKLRAFNFIRELSKYYEIDLISIIDEKVYETAKKIVKKYVKTIYEIHFSKLKLIKNLLLNLFNGKPFQNAFVYDKSIKKQIEKIIGNGKYDYAICLMVRPADYFKGIQIRKMLDYQDALSVGFERRSRKSNLLGRFFYQTEAKRLRKYEQDIFDEFDDKIIITEEDRKYINRDDKEKIVVVPNGIDLDYFLPNNNVERTIDLLFVGNMQYEPNVLCVKYIVQEILPIIQKSKPDVTFMIAGADPKNEVLELKRENIIITGRLDDIRDAYSQGKVFLAPMQTGTGLQNKLLEAMAMRLPVVTSELCNKAINAKENYEILIGRNTEEYAQHCLNLLNNRSLRDAITENALNFVKKNYSWERNVSIIKELIEKFANA